MKRFTAQIRHSYDTILRMCRVQDDTFNFGRKILMALLGLALTVLGAWNLSSVAGLVFALVGCWLPLRIFRSVDLPAPFLPTSAMRSFLFITNDTSAKSGRALNSTLRLSTDSISW